MNYDNHSGLFNITQSSTIGTNRSTFNLTISNENVILGNLSGCTSTDNTRWYSIDASKPNLI